MDELLEGKSLTRALLERYTRNPRNWNFTISPSSNDGFFDALVSNKEEVWQLKLDSLFKPSPLVIGARSDVDPAKVTNVSSVPYGYRKLDPRVLIDLLRALTSESQVEGFTRKSGPTKGVLRRRNSTFSVDSVLGSIDTVVPKAGEGYAEGPFVLTSQRSSFLSENQKKLDETLRVEMKNILKKRFPAYG